jgi:hypothetical protein
MRFLTPRFSLHAIVDPLHQPPELTRREFEEAFFHVAHGPLQKDPRARARPSAGHEMKPPARHPTTRSVAFALEKHLPRRRATPQLAHPFRADTRKEPQLRIGHLEALRALRALKNTREWYPMDEIPPSAFSAFSAFSASIN